MAEIPLSINSFPDLLVALPYTFGYFPSDCVIVFCFRADQTAGLIGRITQEDLDQENVRDSAASIARKAAEDGTTAAQVIVFSDDLNRGIATTFSDALYSHGISNESWQVTKDSYRNLDCHDPDCCTTEQLSDLQHSAVALDLYMRGTEFPIPLRSKSREIDLP